jgi:hypothetical protein
MDEVWFAIQSWAEMRCWVVLRLYRRIVYGMPFRRIPLTHRKFTLVAEDDYDWLTYYKWFANKSSSGIWYVLTNGVNEKGKRANLPMHRIIMNAPKEMLVDHRYGDGLDNRRWNLRLATQSENQCNAVKTKPKGSSSRFRGVGKNKKCRGWHVEIQVNGKIIRLGTYATELEAAKAYDRAAMIYHGQFATLNFPRKKIKRRRTKKEIKWKR